MKIQTRIISAAMLVVAITTIVYAVYFLGKERKAVRTQLEATIKNNETLLNAASMATARAARSFTRACSPSMTA